MRESNLSHEGNSWVFGDALVYGDALVSGNAKVYGDAWVSGDAQVFGDVSTATESYATIGGKKYRFVEVKA